MSKITKKLFKVALKVSIGTQTDMAKRLKVSDSAIQQYFERHPDMKELFNKKRLSNVDLSEEVLFKQLKFKDPKNPSAGEKIRQNAAQFILSRLGKNSGWIEKTETEHMGSSTTFNIIEKSVEEIKDAKSRNKPEAEGDPPSSGG